MYCWVESTGSDYAHVLCQNNNGAIIGDANYAVNWSNSDQMVKEQYRVLAEANADYKGADPNDWDLVPAAVSRAIQALTLNSDCMNLFGTQRTRQGRWNPITVITSMFVLQDNAYGSVDFNYAGVGAAQTRPAGVILPNPFNRNLIQGSRANISIHRNFWNGYGPEQNAETILHELGHVYNFTRGSGGFRLSNLTEGSDPAAFDNLIETNCQLNQH